MDPPPQQNLTVLLEQLMVQFGSSPHSSAEALLKNLTSLLANRPMDSNSSDIWNMLSKLGAHDEDFLWKMTENRRLGYKTTCVLITLYSLLILIGSAGNFLVILAVVRQPAMRTLRNTFIINLAVSDLLLCLVTMPLTLMEIITKYWPLGDSVMSCKMVGGLQAVSIFVSTISITAIALDRYQLVVCPTKDYLKKIGAAAGIVLIWTAGFLLASPIFAVRSLDHHTLVLPVLQEPSSPPGADEADYEETDELLLGGPDSVDYCYENWPITYGRALYSAGTILVQYIAPITVVSVVHARICRRMRVRHSARMSTRPGKKASCLHRNNMSSAVPQTKSAHHHPHRRHSTIKRFCPLTSSAPLLRGVKLICQSVARRTRYYCPHFNLQS